MPRRSSKPADLNSLASAIVQSSVSETEEVEVDEDAVESGREGGKRRAEKLSPERRSEIARKAAEARWKKH